MVPAESVKLHKHGIDNLQVHGWLGQYSVASFHNKLSNNTTRPYRVASGKSLLTLFAKNGTIAQATSDTSPVVWSKTDRSLWKKLATNVNFQLKILLNLIQSKTVLEQKG